MLLGRGSLCSPPTGTLLRPSQHRLLCIILLAALPTPGCSQGLDAALAMALPAPGQGWQLGIAPLAALPAPSQGWRFSIFPPAAFRIPGHSVGLTATLPAALHIPSHGCGWMGASAVFRKELPTSQALQDSCPGTWGRCLTFNLLGPQLADSSSDQLALLVLTRRPQLKEGKTQERSRVTRHTVSPGTRLLTSFVSSSTSVIASSCRDKAARAVCCSSSRRRDLHGGKSGQPGATVGAWEQCPLVGSLEIQPVGPARVPSCPALGCSHPPTQICLSNSGGIKVTTPPGAEAGGEWDPGPMLDSPWPVLLVVLSVAATFWAEALGCQRLLVPLQLLSLQFPDGRADASPLGQVQRCLQLGVTGQGSAPALATRATVALQLGPSAARPGLPTLHTMGPSVWQGPRAWRTLPSTACPHGEQAQPPRGQVAGSSHDKEGLLWWHQDLQAHEGQGDRCAWHECPSVVRAAPKGQFIES